MPDKKTLRAAFRACRLEMNPATHRQKSAAIVERMEALPELQGASIVHCFLPSIDHREVDVRPLITWMHLQKKQIVLPVVVKFNRFAVAGSRLRHVRYDERAGLTVNRWGIEEPATGDEVSPDVLDAVIVPALGAGRNGHRIGFGYGYYDAFLSETSAVRICPVFEACLVAEVPADPHDARLDVIVTEDEVLRLDR